MRPSTRDYLARRYQAEPKVAVYSAQMTEGSETQGYWALAWAAIAAVTVLVTLWA